MGILMNGIDFSHLSHNVGEAEINYGRFIQSIIDFFIISGSIFLFIRLLMKFKREKREETVEQEREVNPQEELLREIRDLLKEQNQAN